jgi:hypothetical protein
MTAMAQDAFESVTSLSSTSSAPVVNEWPHIQGCWNNGPSSDMLDLIWSFISPKEQMSVITLVCHRWNTLNQNGNGWNNISSEKQPFDLNEWFDCNPFSSVVYKLLNDRWHHITSLYMSMPMGNDRIILIQPRLMINIRQVELEYEHHRPIHLQVVDGVLDRLIQLPQLESVTLSGIHLHSGTVCQPTNGWSSCSSLTSLSLELGSPYSAHLDTSKGGFDNLRHISLKGSSWSFSLAPNLPSLTSLSVSHLYLDELELLVPYLTTLRRLDLDNVSYHWERTTRPTRTKPSKELAQEKVTSSLMSILQLIPSCVASGGQRMAGRLTHLGLPYLIVFEESELSWPSNDVLPFMRGLSSFAIMDVSRSLELVKWITKKVQNGLLPLLQACMINEYQRTEKKGVPYRSYDRHQIINGDMLKIDAELLSDKSAIVSSKTVVSPSAPSAASTSSSISISSFQDVVHLNEVVTLISTNITILDSLFSHLSGHEKLFAIERVCRAWRNASKVNGCGWRSLNVWKNSLLSRGEKDKFASLLYWCKLTGNNRLARQRHVSVSINMCEPVLGVLLHRYFPRLASIQLYDIKDAKILTPLARCSYLTNVMVDIDYTGTGMWRWKTIPPSLRHLSLEYQGDRLMRVSLPINWQQQLQSLNLTGRLKPKWSDLLQKDGHNGDNDNEKKDPHNGVGTATTVMSVDQIPSPIGWLSLTSLSCHKGGYKQQTLGSYLRLFHKYCHLIPSLTDIRLPYFNNNELITSIITNYPKLKRFDIGRISPLPLLSLNHLTSFGINLSPHKDGDEDRLTDIITLIVSKPSITHLNIYGSQICIPLVALLRLLPLTSSSSSSSSSSVSSMESLSNGNKNDITNDTNGNGNNNECQIKVLDLRMVTEEWNYIPLEWRRLIHSSEFASFQRQLQQIILTEPGINRIISGGDIDNDNDNDGDTGNSDDGGDDR